MLAAAPGPMRARIGPAPAGPLPALLALAVSLAPAMAPAQEAAPLDRAAVQRHLTRATVFVEQGDHAGAVREFEVIDGWFRTHGDLAAFRWNYADSLTHVGRPLAALESFEMVLALDIPQATRTAVEARIADLRATRLGRLSVECHPADSRIAIDALVEPAPCPLSERDVPAGALTVVVTSPDGVEWRRAVEIPPGQTVPVAAEVPAVLRVESPVAGAVVQVDGRRVGEAGPGDALEMQGLEAGPHAIRVSPPDGGAPWQGKVHLHPGRRVEVTAALAAAPSSPIAASADGAPRAPSPAPAEDGDSDVALWIGVAAGAVALVAGGVALALLADDASGEARPLTEVPVFGEAP